MGRNNVPTCRNRIHESVRLGIRVREMGMVDSVSAAGLSGLQQLNLVSGLVRADALGRVNPPSGRTEPAVELIKQASLMT